MVNELSEAKLTKKPAGALAVPRVTGPSETIEATPARPHEGHLRSTLNFSARGTGRRLRFGTALCQAPNLTDLDPERLLHYLKVTEDQRRLLKEYRAPAWAQSH